MNTLRILVVADATPMRDDVVDAVQKENALELVGTATSPSQALTTTRNTEPDIVLVDETLGDTSTLALMEDMATRYPALTVVAMTREGHMDFARQAMLAGARGFVTFPSADDELPQALRQIHNLEWTRRSRPTVEPTEPRRRAGGKVIAVYSPKGGVGKTTLSVNLGVALADQGDERVALMDANPQFGHLGLVLNVHANYNLMDLISQSEEMDPELIEGMMASHSSGVEVLLAPSEIERADAFPSGTMAELVSNLRTMFDWVVVDTWPVLSESTLDVLETSDQVLLPMIPDITCLRDTRQFLDLAESLNFSLNKFDIIVNRATEGGLDQSAIEDALKRKVVLEIPQDDPLVTHSLNRGIPLVTSHTRSPVSKAVRHLTEWLGSDGAEPATEPGLRSRMKRLLGTAG